MAAGPVTVGVRPESILTGRADGLPTFSARVDVVERLGANSFAYVAAGEGTTLTVELPGMTRIRAGEVLDLSIDPEAATLFGPDGSRL